MTTVTIITFISSFLILQVLVVIVPAGIIIGVFRLVVIFISILMVVVIVPGIMTTSSVLVPIVPTIKDTFTGLPVQINHKYPQNYPHRN